MFNIENQEKKPKSDYVNEKEVSHFLKKIEESFYRGNWGYFINFLEKFFEKEDKYINDHKDFLKKYLLKIANLEMWIVYAKVVSIMFKAKIELPSNIEEFFQKGLDRYEKKHRWSDYNFLISKMEEINIPVSDIQKRKKEIVTEKEYEDKYKKRHSLLYGDLSIYSVDELKKYLSGGNQEIRERVEGELLSRRQKFIGEDFVRGGKLKRR